MISVYLLFDLPYYIIKQAKVVSKQANKIKEKKYIKKINFLILVVAAHVHTRV